MHEKNKTIPLHSFDCSQRTESIVLTAEVIKVSLSDEMREVLMRRTFLCWICIAEEAVLFRARVSRWARTPDEYGTPGMDLKARLLCKSCLDGFQIDHVMMSGFLEHATKFYRPTVSKKPVKYDHRKWSQYLRRYHPEEEIMGGH